MLENYLQIFQAGELFAAAATAVSTEQTYFWLTGLSQVCRGEHALTADFAHEEGDAVEEYEGGDIVDRLAKANSDILLGISSITAATTQYKNHDFQIRFVVTLCTGLGLKEGTEVLS